MPKKKAGLRGARTAAELQPASDCRRSSTNRCRLAINCCRLSANFSQLSVNCRQLAHAPFLVETRKKKSLVPTGHPCTTDLLCQDDGGHK